MTTTMQVPDGFMALDEQPTADHWGGDVYAKHLTLDKSGLLAGKHTHTFDHLSILARGDVRVTVDGIPTDYSAKKHPIVLMIKANKSHEILALSDDVHWFCIHAIPQGCREEDGNIDEVLVGR